MRLWLTALVLAALGFLFWEMTSSGGTYRPSVQPLGWSANGNLLFVHREEEGGYDHRSYSCGASGLYAMGDDGSLRGLMTGARWCEQFPQQIEGLRLSSDGATVYIGGDGLRNGCTGVVALDIGRRHTRELYRNCTSYMSRRRGFVRW